MNLIPVVLLSTTGFKFMRQCQNIWEYLYKSGHQAIIIFCLSVSLHSRAAFRRTTASGDQVGPSNEGEQCFPSLEGTPGPQKSLCVHRPPVVSGQILMKYVLFCLQIYPVLLVVFRSWPLLGRAISMLPFIIPAPTRQVLLAVSQFHLGQMDL